MYIHELQNWPHFTWDTTQLTGILANVKYQQELLSGKMSSLGFDLREQAILKTVTRDIIKTSEIEGEKLNKDEVRSSVAKHLGIDIGGLT